MNAKLRRSVAALATVFACLALMASPASATTHGATITSGNFTLVSEDGSVSQNFPWAGSGGTNCGHTLEIDETATAWNVTQYSSRARIPFIFNAYIIVITRTGSTAGTVSGTTLNASTLSLDVKFYNVLNNSPATDCNTTGSPRCQYTATLSLSGTVTGWTPSSTGTISYPTAPLAWGGGSCAAPHATFFDGTVAAGGFSFTVQ